MGQLFCVCVCERERETERERGKSIENVFFFHFLFFLFSGSQFLKLFFLVFFFPLLIIPFSLAAYSSLSFFFSSFFLFLCFLVSFFNHFDCIIFFSPAFLTIPPLLRIHFNSKAYRRMSTTISTRRIYHSTAAVLILLPFFATMTMALPTEIRKKKVKEWIISTGSYFSLFLKGWKSGQFMSIPLSTPYSIEA